MNGAAPQQRTGRALKAGLPPGTAVHIGAARGTHRPGMRLIDYNDTAIEELDVEDVAACADRIRTGSVTWVNVEGVHDLDQLRAIGACVGLHPLALEDIANTEQRPKLEDYGDYLYIVVKMLSHRDGACDVEQVSLVLGTHFLLSFQEASKPGDVFEALRNRIRQGAGRIRRQGADFLCYSLIDAVVDNYFVILEHLGESIEELEQQLLDHPDASAIKNLYRLRRELIQLRKSVWPLREVLNALTRDESRLVQEGTRIYLRDVYDHTVHIIDTVETLREMLAAMLDIYLSSLSIRMNEVMKVLTVISTIFIPLTFLVGVYGMNFDYMPELHVWWAYPLVWAVMLGVALGMVLYFRRKGWL